MRGLPPRPTVSRQHGGSYIEVLVAAALVTVTLVPAMQALRTSSVGAAVHGESVALHYRVLGRMEEMLAEPFASLETEAQATGDPSTPTSYSDAGGTPNRRLVFLSPYDGDNADADDDPFTGTDDGLIWVRVEIEGTVQALESLSSR